MKVWASRPFGYGDRYPMLDPGQVIEAEPNQKLDQMLRLGLFKKAETKPVQCGKCGAEFVDDGYLNRHGRNNHDMTYVEAGRRESPEADMSTAEELGRLRALEAADEFAERNIPLNLEKTKASREGGRRASR